MSEQGLRSQILAALKPLHAIAVENRVGPGTPDVNYIGGWLELKWRKKWPAVQPHEHILFEHFTPQQRVWIKKRAERGGMVHVLAKIGPDYLLLPGGWASRSFGRCTRDELFHHADWTCSGKLDKKGLMKWLTLSNG